MKILLTVTALLLIPSCSTLAPTEDKIAKELSKAVDYSCEEVLPTLRDRFVSKVNENTTPGNVLAIDCAK
jgi:hypothetical protein